MTSGDRFACGAALVTVVMMAPAPVRAQDTLDDLEPSQARSPKARATVNGYFDNRFTYQLINPQAGPRPTRDVPSLHELVEANLQLRVGLGAPTRFVNMDLSLFYQGGWLFSVPDHDVPGLRPFVVLSELYLSYSPRPWLNIVAGKKRTAWGSGFAFNPADLINPPKDPTDPSFQRAGNWIVRVEAPFKRFTVSALFAPEVLYSQSGIPYALMRFPDYPPADSVDARDQHFHYLVAVRLYALLLETDINLIYYFSNRYQDPLTDKSRFGVSLSRYFFTDWEVHAEALLAQGTARSYPNHLCAALAGRCAPDQAFSPAALHASTFSPRLILGTRRQFADQSLLSLEYYYQADGYSPAQFQDTMRLLAQWQDAAAATGQGAGATTGVTPARGALPQRFTFDPLRSHYLIASYSKRVHDDWTVGGVLIAGLEDLSGVFSPSIAWTPTEWLLLALYSYIPIRGLGVGEARVGNRSWSEYSLAPFDFRLLFETRAYF